MFGTRKIWVFGTNKLQDLPVEVVHAGSSHPEDRSVKMSLLYGSERFSNGEGRCCGKGACSPEECMSN